MNNPRGKDEIEIAKHHPWCPLYYLLLSGATRILPLTVTRTCCDIGWDIGVCFYHVSKTPSSTLLPEIIMFTWYLTTIFWCWYTNLYIVHGIVYFMCNSYSTQVKLLPMLNVCWKYAAVLLLCNQSYRYLVQVQKKSTFKGT